ncbi:MAG: hypothetical protein ACLP0J_19045 [Solirubrobacteraceae bacterium]|jgi:hypothetical protein
MPSLLSASVVLQAFDDPQIANRFNELTADCEDPSSARSKLALGVLGFVTFFGGAILYVRFRDLGLPAAYTVALASRSDLLATGAQFLVVFDRLVTTEFSIGSGGAGF